MTFTSMWFVGAISKVPGLAIPRSPVRATVLITKLHRLWLVLVQWTVFGLDFEIAMKIAARNYSVCWVRCGLLFGLGHMRSQCGGRASPSHDLFNTKRLDKLTIQAYFRLYFNDPSADLGTAIYSCDCQKRQLSIQANVRPRIPTYSKMIWISTKILLPHHKHPNQPSTGRSERKDRLSQSNSPIPKALRSIQSQHTHKSPDRKVIDSAIMDVVSRIGSDHIRVDIFYSVHMRAKSGFGWRAGPRECL